MVARTFYVCVLRVDFYEGRVCARHWSIGFLIEYLPVVIIRPSFKVRVLSGGVSTSVVYRKFGYSVRSWSVRSSVWIGDSADVRRDVQVVGWLVCLQLRIIRIYFIQLWNKG